MLVVNGFFCTLVYLNNVAVELPQEGIKISQPLRTASCRIPEEDMTQAPLWPVLGYLVDFRLLSPRSLAADWAVHFFRNGVPFHSSLSGSVLTASPHLLSLSEPFLGLPPSDRTEPATLEVIVTPSDVSPISLIEADDAQAATSKHIAYFRFECAVENDGRPSTEQVPAFKSDPVNSSVTTSPIPVKSMIEEAMETKLRY
ncbi:hypothetical protein CVT26_015145 [Gymnopilus dilepis]|uniref:Uncharacterized protein n=1 Tax=Gymnopilus dilepis TaxID=231916 RepID=A0A409WXU9_9AGAR|nr:hypothetical protein CVT26_015145 [Gymnopilus dilepis]